MKIIYTKLDDGHLKIYKCQAKANSANKRFDDKITKSDVLNSLKRFDFKCGYCFKPIPTKHWQLDHFNPKANGGKNTHDNLVPCCRWCNTMKNALDGWAFIHKCKQISTDNQMERRFGLPDHYKDGIKSLKEYIKL